MTFNISTAFSSAVSPGADVRDGGRHGYIRHDADAIEEPSVGVLVVLRADEAHAAAGGAGKTIGLLKLPPVASPTMVPRLTVRIPVTNCSAEE